MTRFSAAAGVLLAGLLGCAHKSPAAPTSRPIALPFIENDFSLAVARARDAGLPVFVELWAPW